MQPTSNGNILAVSLKGKLQLYKYLENSFVDYKVHFLTCRTNFTQTFTLQTSSLAWLNASTLLAGLSNGQYAKIDMVEGTCQTMGKSGCEKVVTCTSDSFIASQSILLSMHSASEVVPMLDWTRVPHEIAYLEPYCVARSSGKLEVKMTPRGDYVAAPDVGDAKCLFTDSNALYTAGTTGSIWRLAPVSFKQRVERLVELQMFQEALQLLENDEIIDKTSIVRKLAMHQFQAGDYEGALNQFQKIDTPLVHILSLYFVDPEPKFADRRRAYASLIQHLSAQRANLRASAVDDKQMEEIDTALLEAYLRGNPALVGPLLRVPNSVNLSRGEELLKLHHRERDLIELYFGRGLHEQALDYLHTQSPNQDSKLYGIRPTIHYLARLPLDLLDLTCCRATWAFQTDPMEAMSIFTREGAWEESESQRKIAQYLRALSPPLCTAYMEHIVEQGSSNVEFYDRLLLDYTEEIKADRQKHGKTSLGVRERFRTLLEAPPKYNAEQILQSLPTGGLFEERTILYSRLGQHDKALDLIVNNLQDRAMAEEYCLKHYDAQTNRDVFLLLLQYYTDDTETILQLVNTYGKYLKVSKTLDFIPDDTFLSEVSPFLGKGIQETTDLQCTSAILKHLANADQTTTHLALISSLRQRITVTYDRTCQQCFKRLGTSVFVEANNELSHYACYAQK
jgi:hypothetical protein